MGLSRGRGMLSIWRFGSRRWGLGPQLLFLYLVGLGYYTQHYDLLWHFDSQVIKNQVKGKAIFLGGRILKFKCNTETGKDDRSYFLDEEGPNILYCSIFRYEYDLWGSCENISSWLGIKISRCFGRPRHNIWDKNIRSLIFRQYISNLVDFLEFIDLSPIFHDILDHSIQVKRYYGTVNTNSFKMCWFFCR